MDDRARIALERAQAAAERRKKEVEGKDPGLGRREDSASALPPAAPRPVAVEPAPTVEGAPVLPPRPQSPRSPRRAPQPPPAKEPSIPGTLPSKGDTGPKEEQPNPASETHAPLPQFGVGEVVLAVWTEDRLYYKARIDACTDAGTPIERYVVTFVEYGNVQPDTPLACIAACPPDIVTAPRLESTPAVASIAVGDDTDEEPRELEKSPPPSKAAATTSHEQVVSPQSGKLIGIHADGTPMFMTAEDDAKLKALKKQEKKEKSDQRKDKSKKLFGALSKSKKREEEDAKPASGTVVIGDWKKVSDPTEGGQTNNPPSPRHADSASVAKPPSPRPSAAAIQALSPRRPPPAIPTAAKEEEPLDPLPPIVAPTSVLDFTQVGHLFVALCDLRKLHCDAWVVPTGSDFIPAPYWFLRPATIKARNYAGTGACGLRYYGADARVKRAPGWPDERPVPYLCAIERGSSESNMEWLTRPLKQFLEIATIELKGVAPLRGRLKHLIALPVMGTGASGLPERKGEVIAALLPVLIAHARDRNVDIVLTSNEPSIWAAVQSARAKLPDQFAVPGRLLAKADELAVYARSGKLALFVGAGVSIGAGLPSWGKLLSELMDKAKISVDERKLMEELSLLDQANILKKRLGAAAFSAAVVERLRTGSYSISHSLLASLSVDNVVSTNYDTLFEDASLDAGKPCAVLPYAPSHDMKRFVLKLHGDVNHADDIVLTREDYIRYSSIKSALAGVVQSLLITKHFLFVGFSLTDDNFVKIVDQVRQAMGDKPSKKAFGSATFLFENRLFEELWADIDLISMTTGSKDFAQAGNLLEIWLDFLSFRSCANSSFIMESHFDALLSDEDKAFKKCLAAWLDSFPREARQSPSYTLLKNTLRDKFGGLKIE